MIKNIIFDVGNVFVKWSPQDIVERCFNLQKGSDENVQRAEALFRCPLWMSLNRGELTQREAEQAYQAEFGLSEKETTTLFFHVMDHQDLIEGTEEIAYRLRKAGYRIFALTDNVHEIVAHLKARQRFWDVFEGAVVSAEVGMLKPAPAIFQHALDKFGLLAEETVFFDDVEVNVEGARSIGLEARLFTTPSRCEADLQALGLSF
ncbi:MULTISPECIES: HAD family phosphatase [unclassified Bradyrhizobium]|uniref:HAD family hydrolase n=1 Tax=unclassified Bradyrhizobium TaxID=2631580 RepID=UPI0024792D3C|nr:MULTISPECIES: HAD family phosphatase [unclassified Bradyrhizobium]WGR69260.1 HAD family phosphatase [Bradyrhizobium sp. ISRA426]WGR81315.1 HAD family phosphatase [Bradyrhizobium sp. ISRA430]WGR84499.1 HAD family phosphatase [Bradyrhizobium sp. ISRA432]